MSNPIYIISIVFYSAWFLMLVIGRTRVDNSIPQKSFLSPAATKSLQGIGAAGVFCHHLSQTRMCHTLGEIQIFFEIGFLFVALFFFASGFGLIKSFNSKKGYLNNFLRHRIPSVVVPYYVMNVFCILWTVFLLQKQMSPSEWICKITGVALLNDNAWFVPVITIMYLAFYFIFKNEKPQDKHARTKSFVLIFIVIAVQVGWFLFNKHFPWWLGEKDWWRAEGALWTAPWWKRTVALWFEGEWWVNSTIAFLFGMIVAQYEEKFISFFSRAYWLKLLISVLVFAGSVFLMFWAHEHDIHYWLEFAGDNSTKPRAIMMAINTLMSLSFCLMIILFMFRSYSDNKVTRFLGNYSLEIYLMQVMPMREFQIWFGFADQNLNEARNVGTSFGDRLFVLAYALCTIAATILLAVLLKYLSSRVIKLLFPKKELIKTEAA